MGAAKRSEILQPGERAPDFDLQYMDEGRRTLRDLLAAGPVLLAFFKSTCPVCQMTLPYLERIHRGRSPDAYSIYGISQDDIETTEEFKAEFGIDFPVLLDTEESGYTASNDYRISHVPSLFLVTGEGKIAWSLEGFVKREFEGIAAQAGVQPFGAGEKVPEWKSG